jgi:hypothetical protein
MSRNGQRNSFALVMRLYILHAHMRCVCHPVFISVSLHSLQAQNSPTTECCNLFRQVSIYRRAVANHCAGSKSLSHRIILVLSLRLSSSLQFVASSRLRPKDRTGSPSLYDGHDIAEALSVPSLGPELYFLLTAARLPTVMASSN